MCARRRSGFLLLRQKKVTKEKATLHAASLRFAAGNLRCSDVGRAVELALRCARRSDNHGESVHEARALRRPCRPTPCAPRRIVKGPANRTSTRAIAALGPACAARGACARERGPSVAKARVAVRLLEVRMSNPLLAAPAAGRLWGGMGVEAPMLRELTRRSCPNEAAKQRSEFCGAPRNRPAAGLPLRNAKGSQTGGRLSFAYFSLAKQRKVSRLPGRQPGSRPQPQHAFQTSTPSLRQAQPERVGKQRPREDKRGPNRQE